MVGGGGDDDDDDDDGKSHGVGDADATDVGACASCA